MNRFVFIGGSKGVGKSSLSKEISKRLEFEYINTGERFRRYRPKFKENFIKELINSKGNFLIDTHYAASSSKTPHNFLMGIDEESLLNLKLNSQYSGSIYLITADSNIILERRIKDKDPRRCLELSQIRKENGLNEIYSKIYASCLNLPLSIFDNGKITLEESITKIEGELKK